VGQAQRMEWGLEKGAEIISLYVHGRLRSSWAQQMSPQARLHLFPQLSLDHAPTIRQLSDQSSHINFVNATTGTTVLRHKSRYNPGLRDKVLIWFIRMGEYRSTALFTRLLPALNKGAMTMHESKWSI